MIGYLESHGRVETLSQAEGLETVPRRRLEYRGAALEEMDLPAILRRRPELCLPSRIDGASSGARPAPSRRRVRSCWPSIDQPRLPPGCWR